RELFVGGFRCGFGFRGGLRGLVEFLAGLLCGGGELSRKFFGVRSGGVRSGGSLRIVAVLAGRRTLDGEYIAAGGEFKRGHVELECRIRRLAIDIEFLERLRDART